MSFLGVILMFPWFVVLSIWFVLVPRHPAGMPRRGFEAGTLLLALLLSILAMRWGFTHADPNAGAIWKQVLAALLAYAAFLITLLLALPIRRKILRHAAAQPGESHANTR